MLKPYIAERLWEDSTSSQATLWGALKQYMHPLNKVESLAHDAFQNGVFGINPRKGGF